MATDFQMSHPSRVPAPVRPGYRRAHPIPEQLESGDAELLAGDPAGGACGGRESRTRKEAGTGRLVWRARVDDVLRGDQAAQMGPALMIATGEDLVTLITSGVDDLVPKAKAILALVKPKL